MHLRNVDLFCEAVRCRSFSKAAEARGVSQPLVSQAVGSLEERLGTLLIDRSKRPFEVTPAGQVYYDGCQEILEQIRRIEDRVQRMGNKVTGRVRVASIYSISLSQMEAYERRFIEQYPDAALQVEYFHPDEVYRRVLENEADIGIVSFPRDGGEFSSIPWLEQELVVVLPPSHRLAGRQSLRVSDLEGEDFVAFTADLRIRRQIDRWLKQEKVAVSVAQQFDNVDSIKSAVGDGAGIALLPLPTIRRELESGELKAARLAGVTWRRPVGMVHRRHKGLSTAAQKFVELLQQEPDPAASQSAASAAAKSAGVERSNGAGKPHSNGNGAHASKKPRRKAVTR